MGIHNYYFNSNDWKVADTMSKSREESFLSSELVDEVLKIQILIDQISIG